MQSTQDVVVAGTGAVYVAPEDTALPADLAAPPVAWTDIGYVSEDGVQFTFDRNQEEINAWQVSTPVRVLVTSEPISIAFELLQFDRETLMLAFRGGTITGAAAPFKYEPPDAGSNDVRALLVDAVDGDSKFRFAFPRVSISDAVEMSLVRSDATRLPLTFQVLAADTKWNILSDHPAFAAGAGAVAVDESMGREELNKRASQLGVADPESMPNKKAVIDAIADRSAATAA